MYLDHIDTHVFVYNTTSCCLSLSWNRVSLRCLIAITGMCSNALDATFNTKAILHKMRIEIDTVAWTHAQPLLIIAAWTHKAVIA